MKEVAVAGETGVDLVPEELQCFYRTVEKKYEIHFDVRNRMCQTANVSESNIRVRIWNGCSEINETISFEEDQIHGAETVKHTAIFSGDQGCKCCRVLLDDAEVVDEVCEENNTANRNDISTRLVTGIETEVLSEIITITNEYVAAANEIVDPPAGWDVVQVEPLSVVLGPLATAPIKLAYLAPPDATSTMIQVLTTEAETGFTQDNLFWLISPAVPAVSEWGLAVMALLVLTAGTLVFIRRRRGVSNPARSLTGLT